MSLQHLIPILQVAIGPVILISGVGLLLLAMTNRFGRIVDRSRKLSQDLRSADGTGEERTRIEGQLVILMRRAALVRLSISLSAVSVLLAAVLIIFLFLAALVRFESGVVVAALFIGCMACLIASLVYFIKDINQSLAALKLEVGPRGEASSRAR